MQGRHPQAWLIGSSPMEYLLPVLAGSALLLALSAWMRSAAHAARLNELEQDLIRRTRDLSAEMEQGLSVQRRLLTTLAQGGELDAEMIEDGRIWRDVSGSEALALVNDAEAHILDVRTPRETIAGFAENAIIIPIDELESRAHELPKDGKPLVIYCAAGVRSAAACDFLSSLGHSSLYNLAGGFAAWTGSRATS